MSLYCIYKIYSINKIIHITILESALQLSKWPKLGEAHNAVISFVLLDIKKEERQEEEELTEDSCFGSSHASSIMSHSSLIYAHCHALVVP